MREIRRRVRMRKFNLTFMSEPYCTSTQNCWNNNVFSRDRLELQKTWVNSLRTKCDPVMLTGGKTPRTHPVLHFVNYRKPSAKRRVPIRHLSLLVAGCGNGFWQVNTTLKLKVTLALWCLVAFCFHSSQRVADMIARISLLIRLWRQCYLLCLCVHGRCK